MKINKNVREVLIKYINLGLVSVENGSKHVKVRNLLTLDWIPVAGSPSDYRAKRKFQNDLKNLVENGRGLIYAKTGHLPILG